MVHLVPREDRRIQVRLQAQIAREIREVEMFEHDDNLVFAQENLGLQRIQVDRMRLVFGDQSSVSGERD